MMAIRARAARLLLYYCFDYSFEAARFEKMASLLGCRSQAVTLMVEVEGVFSEPIFTCHSVWQLRRGL